MSKPALLLAAMSPANITFRGASVASSEAAQLSNAPADGDGRQMAISISRFEWQDEPYVVLGVIHGDRQMTVSLNPDEMDKLCHLLADGALWQNERLRQKSGQAVH